MSTTLQSEITAVRQQIEAATAKLKELEVRAAEPPPKWNPKGGGFLLGLDGLVYFQTTHPHHANAGSCYPTREAAESALPYVNFYKRLCALAQELNPSGKVGGVRYVVWNDNRWDISTSATHPRYPDCVFETAEAAEQAAFIMNRDGWKLPG